MELIPRLPRAGDGQLLSCSKGAKDPLSAPVVDVMETSASRVHLRWRRSCAVDLVDGLRSSAACEISSAPRVGLLILLDAGALS